MLVKNGCEEEKQNAKATLDAADGNGRAAAFAAKLKEADLRKGDFAQDFLDTVETSDDRPAVPIQEANAQERLPGRQRDPLFDHQTSRRRSARRVECSACPGRIRTCAAGRAHSVPAPSVSAWWF